MHQDQKYRPLTDEEEVKLNRFLSKKKLETLPSRTVRGAFYEMFPTYVKEFRRADLERIEAGWGGNLPNRKRVKGRFV